MGSSRTTVTMLSVGSRVSVLGRLESFEEKHESRNDDIQARS